MKKIIALLMVAAMAASFAACGGGNSTTTTDVGTQPPAATTTFNTTRRQPKPESSFNKKAESELDVQPVDPLTLPVDLTLEQVIGQLPEKLWVKVPATFSGSSEELFKADFSSIDEFKTLWDYYDLDEVVTIEGGKATSIGGSTRFMTAVKEPAWGFSDTDHFTNYAVKATLTAIHDQEGNFGLTFRATDLTGVGPDNYIGMYFGIDEDPSTGQTYVNVGKSNSGTWNELKGTTIEHATGTPYEVEILVCFDKYIVNVDGEKVLEGDIDPIMNQGSAGFRSYVNSFECSDFSVRSLGADDYALFGGYFDVQLHDVKWSCFDYEPKKGKYGFFGDIEGLGKTAQTKALITIDPKEKPLTTAPATTIAPVTAAPATKAEPEA